MFNQIGWSELIVLAIVGLVVLGPERLPKAAADAARMERREIEVCHLGTELSLEVGGRVTGHRPQLTQHPRGVGCGLRQPFRAEHDEADDRQDDQLAPPDLVEHQPLPQSLGAEPSVTTAVCRAPSRR